jgi:hypothetical protein
MISYRDGSRYRFRSGVGHVITEVQIKGDWYVVETFVRNGDRFLIRDNDKDGVPFFRLDELTPDPKTGKTRPVWDGFRGRDGPSGVIYHKPVSDYYSVIQPDKHEVIPPVWLSPEIKVGPGERLTIREADFTSLDLMESGSLPGQSLTGAPLSVPLKRLKEAVVRRPVDKINGRVGTEHPFLLHGVSLRLREDQKKPDQWPFPLLANDAVKVFPKAPAWAIDSRTVIRPTDRPPPGSENAPRWYWNWRLFKGRQHILPGSVLLVGQDTDQTSLELRGGYKNLTSKIQLIWFPMVYRTDTPTPRGVAEPVAQIRYTTSYFNVYPRRRSLYYADLVFPVDPGDTLSVAIVVEPKKRMEILSLGEPVNISDVISPSNPVYAADIDVSGVPSEWKDKVALEYRLMVNPFLLGSVQK